MLRTFSRPSLISPRAVSIYTYLLSTSGKMSSSTLVYLIRRDLRLEDNPIFHAIADKSSPFTHVLPVYVFAAQQLEVSGFIPDSTIKSPYPEARSATANFWRCGPHRAKFLAESVWDLKKRLEAIQSGLEIRVGLAGEVMKDLVEGLSKDGVKVSVWMTSEEGSEEKDEERDVKAICESNGAEFKVFTDEKYYIDE
jgi:deoxyribodipyrimidine photo-lyase